MGAECRVSVGSDLVLIRAAVTTGNCLVCLVCFRFPTAQSLSGGRLVWVSASTSKPR